MDRNRRRQLKAEGRLKVEEDSRRVHEQLRERNPFPVGDRRWVENLKAEYRINRKYRQNVQGSIPETEALVESDVKELGFNLDSGLMRRKGWYIQCLTCRELVPTACSHDLQCICGLVHVVPSQRTYSVVPGKYRVVELIGRGPIRTTRKAWWRIW